MPWVALLLVLIAACTHASWNLLAKQAAASTHFVLLYSLWAVLLWSPAAAWIVVTQHVRLGPWQALALLGTGVLHVAYSLCLQRGYREADLSVVYPLARGTGPLVSFVGAIVVLGERPSLFAGLGALLVVAGVLLIARGNRGRVDTKGNDTRKGVLYGITTGVLVASYTVWDGWSVKSLLLPPMLVDFSGNVLRCLILLPHVMASPEARRQLRDEHRGYARQALGVALLGPLGYILILYATRLSTVSRVAPAREMSMMIGAYLGARILKEQDMKRRVLASGLIVCGVLALALG